MNESLILYITSHKNGELLGTCEAHRDIKQPDRFVIPPYYTPNAYPSDTLTSTEYWALLDSNDKPVRDYLNGAWVKTERQQKVNAYNKQTMQPKKFDDTSLVTDEYTLEKPSTQWDEWINDAWVTNKSNQYIAEYNQVDNVRRGLYVQICDPLIAEANIKRLQGFDVDTQTIEAQALAARDKIQTEHPWPTPPVT
ncbi:hypothetical protein [Vibrio sp. Vb339]|uniref:hypothetical protein n=1 Tax=Vibrio sp. Vb339 TaxID=1192013 RepID=UPI001551DF1C|nr:hypothetical protein [Vibrio sp. Vb339]